MTQQVREMTSEEREAELAERAKTLTALALDAGADEAEVYARHSQSTEVNFEKGELKLTTIEEGAAVGLRVFKERRLGFASTNQVESASLAEAARDAAALAALSPPDEANLLPGEHGDRTELPLGQSDLGSLDVARVVELGQELVARTTSVDPRISLGEAKVSLGQGSAAIHSSAGADATESDMALSFSLFGMAVDGDDVGGFDYWGATARSIEQIEPAMAESIQRFSAAALGNLGAGAAESYEGPVLFSPAAFQSVFLSPLISAVSARAVQRGRSPLADKRGEAVATAAFSLLDNPHDTSLNGATSFDREGVSTSPFPIVTDGVLQGFLYDGHAAHVEGVRSTGHAVGGAAAVPSIGTHGITVSGGSGGAPEAMMQRLDRGLLVQRFSGSVDPASGDFSGVAKSARWIEGGLEARPVRETLFAGNVFQLFHRIIDLSDSPESVMGGSRVPWALIDGLSVTAG